MGRHESPPTPVVKEPRPSLRELPEVVRRRVAADRVKPRESLWDASGGTFQFFVFGPFLCFAGAIALLGGTWWQRLLAVPAAACGVALTRWAVWYVQRPALPREPGLIRCFLRWQRSRGR